MVVRLVLCETEFTRAIAVWITAAGDGSEGWQDIHAYSGGSTAADGRSWARPNRPFRTLGRPEAVIEVTG